MTSKLNINWLNKCRCGNRMHTVETVRGSHVRLFEDDAVKCNACGREGVIQTCDGIATVLWETDEERAEGVTMTKSTITRERAQQIFLGNGPEPSASEERELARMALAAMDSEPVGKPFMYGIADPDGNAYIDEFCVSEDLGLVEDTVNELNYDREEGDELNYSVAALYRHAQPAPVVPEKCPAEIRYLIASHSDALFNDDDAQEIWNACRAAMLPAAPQEVR